MKSQSSNTLLRSWDRIEQVVTRLHFRAYETAHSNPHMAWAGKSALLVFVITEQGHVGVGEAWCDAASIVSVNALVTEDLIPQVKGKILASPESLWANMVRLEPMNVRGSALYAAMSALDGAIWDALARSLDIPLFRLLGGARKKVPVYGSAGLYVEGQSPAELASELAGAVERGCYGVKMKVAGASIEEDVVRVAAVREALGSEPDLMVDALFQPDVAQAIELGRAISPSRITFYEAPTDRRNLRGWEEIGKRTGLSLSGPEMESGIDRFAAFAMLPGLHYLQCDAIVCGGPTEVRRIAGLAASRFLPLTFHCSGSAISLAVNASCAAAFTSGHSVEMHLLHQSLFDRLWQAGYAVEAGSLILPEAPGLGLQLDIDDPELTKVV